MDVEFSKTTTTTFVLVKLVGIGSLVQAACCTARQYVLRLRSIPSSFTSSSSCLQCLLLSLHTLRSSSSVRQTAPHPPTNRPHCHQPGDTSPRFGTFSNLIWEVRRFGPPMCVLLETQRRPEHQRDNKWCRTLPWKSEDWHCSGELGFQLQRWPLWLAIVSVANQSGSPPLSMSRCCCHHWHWMMFCLHSQSLSQSPSLSLFSLRCYTVEKHPV